MRYLSKFEIEVMRGGKLHRQSFSKGAPITELEVVDDVETTGTKITFYPDAQRYLKRLYISMIY